jgi:hypothetical protein
MAAAALAKIPTTSARRAISRLTRSSGFVDRNFDQCAVRKGHERQEIVLGGLEQRADLRDLVGEPVDQRADTAARLGVVGALKTSLRAADTMPRCEGRQWPCMLRTKCTQQRCQGASSTPAIAVFRPSWWSETTSRSPLRRSFTMT